MEPTLRILIAASQDSHFSIERGEFDVAVALFADRVEGARHVLASCESERRNMDRKIKSGQIKAKRKIPGIDSARHLLYQ